MRLPRDVNGRDLVRHLIKHWDYSEVTQRGSHIILITETPSHHRLPVPDHRPLRTGTFSDIVGQVCEHKQVSRESLLYGL